jgi:hypothetical protein
MGSDGFVDGHYGLIVRSQKLSCWVLAMWFYLSSSSWDIVTQTIAITSEVPQGTLIIACTLPTFGCCRLLFGVVFLVDSGCELVVERLESSPPAHCLSRYRNFHPGSIFHWIFDSAMRKDL